MQLQKCGRGVVQTADRGRRLVDAHADRAVACCRLQSVPAQRRSDFGLRRRSLRRRTLRPHRRGYRVQLKGHGDVGVVPARAVGWWSGRGRYHRRRLIDIQLNAGANGVPATSTAWPGICWFAPSEETVTGCGQIAIPTSYPSTRSSQWTLVLFQPAAFGCGHSARADHGKPVFPDWTVRMLSPTSLPDQ